MRTLVALSGILGSCLLLACSSPAGPSADGPAFLQATLNGQSWAADPLEVSASLRSDHRLVVYGQQEVAGQEVPNLITIAVRATGPGRWTIPPVTDTGNGGATFDGRLSPADPVNDYRTDSLHTGVLMITHFDTTTRVVTGIFSFTAMSPDHHPLTVTSGSFRVTYLVLP